MASKAKHNFTPESIDWLKGQYGAWVNSYYLADALIRKDGKPLSPSTPVGWGRKPGVMIKKEAPGKDGKLIKINDSLIRAALAWYPINKKSKKTLAQATVKVTQEEAQEVGKSIFQEVLSATPQVEQGEISFEGFDRPGPKNRFLVMTPTPTLYTDGSGNLFVVIKVAKGEKCRYALASLAPDLANGSTCTAGKDSLEEAVAGMEPVPLGSVVYIDHYGSSR